LVLDAVLFLLGMFAGMSGSLVGLGGGFIVVPALTFLFPGMLPAHIAGTSMAMLLFNSISSTYVYAKQKRIDYAAAIWFAIASIPGAVLGAFMTAHIAGKAFFISFGLFLICVSLLLLFKPKQPLRLPLKPTVHRNFIDAAGQRFDFAYNRPIGVACSFLVGFLSSLFGVGGGSLMVPTMTLLLFFPPHIAVATSMLQIFLSAIVSTSTHAYLHNIDWLKVLFLSPGAIIGGQIGARIAKRLPAGLILKLLAVMMILVAFRLILK
jgi:uncharacterized protein